MPEDHGSANANPMTYPDLVKLKDRTLEEIKAEFEKQKHFNPGVSWRERERKRERQRERQRCDQF